MSVNNSIKSSGAFVEDDKDVVYLSGPVRCVEDDGRKWRGKVIERYRSTFEFRSPLDRFDPNEHEILRNPENLDESSDRRQVLPCEYVLEDKVLITESDYILVGLPESIARGTMMECMWGFCVEDTPFFVWTIDGQEESGWIYHHSEFMSDDLDEVMKEIER